MVHDFTVKNYPDVALARVHINIFGQKHCLNYQYECLVMYSVCAKLLNIPTERASEFTLQRR